MAVTIAVDNGARVYTVTGNDTFRDNFPGEKGVDISGTFTSVTESLPGATTPARTITGDETYFSRMGVSDFAITGTNTVIRITPLQQQTTSTTHSLKVST